MIVHPKIKIGLCHDNPFITGQSQNLLVRLDGPKLSVTDDNGIACERSDIKANGKLEWADEPHTVSNKVRIAKMPSKQGHHSCESYD